MFLRCHVQVETSGSPGETAPLSFTLSTPQDTPEFCSRILTSPDLVSYVNDNFIAWGGDVQQSDAFQVGGRTYDCVREYHAHF